MRLLLASAIATSTAALTALIVVSSAVAETKTYDFAGFNRIEASAGFTIRFTQSPTWSVKVDSRFNNLDKILIEKDGDTLRISRPKGFCSVVTRDGSAAVKSPSGEVCVHHEIDDVITVSAPDLEALKLHAGVTFEAAQLKLDKLSLDGSAGISIDIDDLRVSDLNVGIGAGSSLTVAGTCTNLNARLGPASTVEAKNLKCREANIDAGVASHVEAFASEKANASAGISASVLISGKPASFTKSEGRFGSTVELEN